MDYKTALKHLTDTYGYPHWYGVESNVWRINGSTVLKLSRLYRSELQNLRLLQHHRPPEVATIHDVCILGHDHWPQKCSNNDRLLAVLILQEYIPPVDDPDQPMNDQPRGLWRHRPPRSFYVGSEIWTQFDTHDRNFVRYRWIDTGCIEHTPERIRRNPKLAGVFQIEPRRV